jgi:hypothetical protein
MAHPARNACPKAILSSARAFFVTTKTSMARRLLQSERNAMLLIDVLRLYVAAGKFQLHDFDGNAFCSIANISFRTLSKQGSPILLSNTPTATLTWPRKSAGAKESA